MRNLYNEFFYIPKQGKIREKVMLASVALIIAIMIVCLAAMGFTAYAYFSYDVTSGSNIIKGANFETKVSIIEINNSSRSSSTSVDVFKTENGTQAANLTADIEYEVTIELGDSTAETGFCVITAKNCTDKYYTQQLKVDKSVMEGNTPSITFTLTVTEDTTVEILSHWGTSSYYGYENRENNPFYIQAKDKVTITVDTSNSSSESESDEEEETATPTPETPEPSTATPEPTTTQPPEASTPEAPTPEAPTPETPTPETPTPEAPTPETTGEPAPDLN